ncbi:MAG: hypothetical protein GY810_08030 [Aureispira sp.]|nr:hypothetical protein [Aureispira sp.]
MRGILVLLTGLVLITFVACNSTTPESNLLGDNLISTTQETPMPSQQNGLDHNEETTISVKMSEHSVQLVMLGDEIKDTKLSKDKVKELESWWDSLPKPIQSQIMSNKLDISVESNIKTSPNKTVDPSVTNTQVENTGETLEKIIGATTDMTYTVNTTVIENGGQKSVREHATNIHLVKKMPVKLKEFTAQIFIDGEDVSNDNMQSLQYWWLTLPQEIQEKIQNRELSIDIACHIIDQSDLDIEQDKQLGEHAEDHLAIMEGLLDGMIGVYRVSGMEQSVAKINTKSLIEPTSAQSIKYPSSQYIKLTLRTNKAIIPQQPL